MEGKYIVRNNEFVEMVNLLKMMMFRVDCLVGLRINVDGQDELEVDKKMYYISVFYK